MKQMNILHRCVDCYHAEMHEWSKDEPLIARCLLVPVNNIRKVARSYRRCATFTPRSRLMPVHIIKHAPHG